MESVDLGKIAHDARFMRESGVALMIGSFILALLFFVPLSTGDAPHLPLIEPVLSNAYEHVLIEAQASIVYDLSTNTILYEKNSEAQLPLASLTKLLAVLGALSELDPDTLISITKEDEEDSRSANFLVGDTFRLTDLAKLTLVGSLNDGATAIARATSQQQGTSIPLTLANAASAINLSETYAVNGAGLDQSVAVSGGYGSAHDVALLSGALVQKAPDIAAATSFENARATTVAGKTYTFENTNPTVLKTPRLLLSKTGYTKLAGGNLAIVFDAGINHPIAVVVLGSTESGRFLDVDILVSATLDHFSGLAPP